MAPDQDALGDLDVAQLIRHQVGFGGAQLMLPTKLHLEDKLYAVVKLRVTKEGRAESKDGPYETASLVPEFLRMLTAGQAATVAGGNEDV